jgi:hypothetical protein
VRLVCKKTVTVASAFRRRRAEVKLIRIVIRFSSNKREKREDKKGCRKEA